MSNRDLESTPSVGNDLSAGRSPVPDAVPNVDIDTIEANFKNLIQGREEQRKKMFCWIMIVAGAFSIALLILSIIFVCKIISFVANADGVSEALKSAGSLWHILLILLTPPTAVITLMVRSISFTANERDLGNNSHDDSSNIPILNLIRDLGNAIIDLLKSKADK